MTHHTSCTAFHRERDLAVVSLNGVLNLWDADSGSKKREFTPASHLTSSFTCLSWKVQQTIATTKKRTASKRKSKAAENNVAEEVIALGTTTGEIFIYDVKIGDLVGKLDGGHKDKVNCICWDPSDLSLLSCSEDHHIVHWDVSSYKSICKWQGDKRGVSSICMAPHSTLLSAGKMIKLWDIQTKVLLRKFTGHANPVLSLLCINPFSKSLPKNASTLEKLEGLYFLSSASDDRIINAWQVQSKHKKIAIGSFALNSDPVSMVVKSPSMKNKQTFLMALTEDGELNIFSHILNGQMTKPLEVQMIVTVVDPAANKLRILSASFIENSDSETATILIAYGTNIKIVFERVNLDDYPIKEVVLIREDPMKIEVTTDGTSSKTREPIRNGKEVTTLAPGLPGHGLESIPKLEVTTENRSKRRKLTDDSVNYSETREQIKNGNEVTTSVPKLESISKLEISTEDRTRRKKLTDDPMNESEMTMEERVSALSVRRDSESERNAPPRADSLCVLLTQGLQSNDSGIINEVLHNCNLLLVKNTLKQLPITVVITLVQILINKMRASPMSATKFSLWLRETLKIHASYLMTHPSLVPVLSELYQLMDARTQTYRRFVQLEGKLELLTSQIQRKKSESRIIDTAPMFVYEDESSDEQEDVLLDDLPEGHSDDSDNEWDDLKEMEIDGKEVGSHDEDETDSGVANGAMEED